LQTERKFALRNFSGKKSLPQKKSRSEKKVRQDFREQPVAIDEAPVPRYKPTHLSSTMPACSSIPTPVTKAARLPFALCCLLFTAPCLSSFDQLDQPRLLLQSGGDHFFSGSRFFMQLHQLDLVPGDSVRVGRFLVTVVAVDNGQVQLHIEDPENGTDFWSDPFDACEVNDAELVTV
jgi:hypothetical protein